MALVLTGDGVGRGCSVHGTSAYRSDCEECASLPPLPYHGQPGVVLLGDAGEMPESNTAPLNLSTLTKKYDEMFERMQKPGAREAMQRAFEATPEELGKAAVEYATRRCNGCRYGSHCLGANPDCVCCKPEVS
jgi:hypothetical protein